MKRLFLALTLVILVLSAVIYLTRPKPQTGQTAATSYADQSKWKVWQSSYYSKPSQEGIRLTLDYPRDFDKISGPELGYPSYLSGQGEVVFSFPADAFKNEPQSNFGQAYLALSVEQNMNENSCFTFMAAPMTGKLVVNGIEFRTASSTEGAAGSLYEARVYRTLFQGRCIEMVETLSTGNIGNYPPSTTQEFDKNRAWSVLDSIRESLRLEKLSGQ